MRPSLAISCLALGLAAPAPAADWTPLFNGKDLDGWAHVGPGRMVVEDRAIKTEGGMGLLWYTRQTFGDCTIRVVYKTEKKDDNSGVFIRIAEKPRDEWFAVHHGYEVQIQDSADEYHRTGAIYSFSKAAAQPAKVGEWNTMEITLKGNLVTVTVNGEPVNSFDPSLPPPPRTKDYEPERGPRPHAGYIGLQNHDARSAVLFREVSIKPL